jgi:GTPase SAR1 family protein
MTTDDESTAGVDTLLWTLEQEEIKVRIWDFAGHTVTHAVHQFFLSERCLYLMVYNGRTEEKNSLEYWLNHMKNYGGDSQAIILVNERDRHGADIKTNFLKENYPIAGIYHLSIRDDAEKLQLFREDVEKYIKTNPSWENQVIPSNYYQVKEELEQRFSKGGKHKAQEHISRDAFNQIADKYEVEDQEKLLQALHCLGVSLWYKNMAGFDTLVLNPEWISHGVYKIINWVHEAKKYSLTLKDFTTVFAQDASRYPEDKHKFLFELMMHYELAYETKEDSHLIISHLLNEDRPEELPHFSIGESLMLRYKAEQPLPPNTISRFIVRHNQQIKKDQQENSVWRYGVILEDGKGSLALVREENRTISVSVKGLEKTNFIAEMRGTLNDIFNSYKSDKPELQYRIERHGELPAELETKNQVWLPDRKILNQSNDNVPYYDDITRQNLDLNSVVHLYQITAENLILGGHGNQVLVDQSTHTTFNFYDCNINLQGDLNDLAQLLTELGEKEEAKKLENTAKALEQLEQCKSKDEVKKKGLANRLRRVVEDLGDKESKLGKAVKGIENGIEIAQSIAKRYNGFADWMGFPHVPKPFL